MKLEFLLRVVTAGIVCLSLTSQAYGDETAPKQKPNIVFIMADDLGPGWVDFDGSNKQINTPNLQQLAENGMVFTRAYAAASVCSPTRAACITGMSPAQIGLTTHIPGKAGRRHSPAKGGPVDAPSINALPLNLPSYARELKKLGYATGFMGKWHLAGEGSVDTKDGIVDGQYHPEHFGFDSNIAGCAYGQPESWFDPFRNGTIADQTKGEYLTDRLGNEAAEFINANKDQPFHLSLWFYSVHKPIKAPKELVQRNGGNAYLAMLECMDNAVGKVLDTLDAAGVRDNTLVVFYSDNGGDKATSWLAEKKGSLLEGGLRVPMVVNWPGVIAAGSQTDEPVTSMDFFPTFVQAAGGSTEKISQLEGTDLMPLLQGEPQLDRDYLFWHYPHNRKGVKYNMGSVVLSRDWKLYQGLGVVPDALFNLDSDSMEKHNVLSQNPEVAKRLRGQLNQWLTKVNAKMPRSSDEKDVSVADKSKSPKSKPNFIILLTDDQGYQDLGCYGSPNIKTPRIDAMASQGIRFTDFYAQPVCGPSRKAILTGCYPLRTATSSLKERETPHPRLGSSEITIAEILQAQGYATAAYGKWDMDGRFKFASNKLLATHQGFDYYFGAPDDGMKKFLENDKRIKPLPPEIRTQRYTDKAISFIKENKHKPFFAYVAYHMPHVELAASKEFKGKSAGGLYGDVVEELDHNVGRVLDVLVEEGLDKNTYVLFASDNGPWYLGNDPRHVKMYGGKQQADDQGGSAIPLRGDKTTNWDGAFRVPSIMWAPGRIPSGQVSAEIATTLDIMPTFAKLAGAAVPTDRVIDGHDIGDLIHGVSGVKSPTKAFYFYIRESLRAVRAGKWKLHVPHKPDEFWQRFYRDGDYMKITEPVLYDLESDVGETTNVADAHPEVVATLMQHIEFARKDIGDGDRIGENARFESK